MVDHSYWNLYSFLQHDRQSLDGRVEILACSPHDILLVTTTLGNLGNDQLSETVIGNEAVHKKRCSRQGLQDIDAYA